jgi:protein arginine kinase activator
MEELRQRLEEAVARENYEQAAQLRDRIRQMEREVEGTRR